MRLPYSERLDIAHFSRLFDNKSECYKLFWFQAIARKIKEGHDTLTFEMLIDEMIADAWYMVSEYRLNLGPSDALERVVHRLGEISNMKPCEKKERILAYLADCGDKKVIAMKRILSQNVPYRLQAPFMESMKGKEWSRSGRNLAERINQEQRLMYYFLQFNGLNTQIRIQEEWADYIERNYEIIQGWVELNLIQYLQRRNPSVPGITDKIYPPRERNLEKVKKYWKMIASIQPIQDIYGETRLDERNISIDHFVPWSYVAHDELWNLTPTTRNINSSKSNHLPDWNTYFPMLCRMEYSSYEMMWKYPEIYSAFEKCAREHLNNQEIKHKLYQNGLSEAEFAGRLEDVLLPVYQSAKNMGFSSWRWRTDKPELFND